MKLSHAGEKIALERLGVGAATVTRLTRTLEKAGFVEEASDAADLFKSLMALAHHIQGKPGRHQCIYCGCTEDHACMLGGDAPRPCVWWNQDHTCCDNPDCKRRHQAAIDLAAKKAGVR
jgi:hypothetical protein